MALQRHGEKIAALEIAAGPFAPDHALARSVGGSTAPRAMLIRRGLRPPFSSIERRSARSTLSSQFRIKRRSELAQTFANLRARPRRKSKGERGIQFCFHEAG